MSNILVTGGSGFIGSHTIEALKNEKHNVFNMDVVKPDDTKNYININLNDTKKITDFLKENSIEYVYHIAAIANARRSIEDVVETMDVNVKGTASLLLACSEANIKKVILASTVWVYNAVDKSKNVLGEKIYLDETSNIKPECGGHFYTTSKLVSEFLCQDFLSLKKLNFTILRYGIPYGPRMWKGLVLRSFTENALNKEPLNIVGDGSAKRRFVHIKDLTRAHVMSLSDKADNQIFNLEGSSDTTIKELADLVSKYIPGTEINYITDESRKGELSVDNSEITNSKAKNILGWEPTISIEEGVKGYVEYFKKLSS